jgi:HEAT repeat protein
MPVLKNVKKFVRDRRSRAPVVPVALVVLLLSALPRAAAQNPNPPAPPAGPAIMSPAERAALTEGWGLLAQGEYSAAASRAAALLARYPGSAAVLSLAVESRIALGGALAGLSTYEQWLAGRTLEDPYVLRQVGEAYLREMAHQSTDPGVALEALKGLAADGDQDAQSLLLAGAKAGGFAETRALASLGSPAAERSLVTDLGQPGDKSRAINALVEGKMQTAVPALEKVLSDPLELNRAAAADALGRLGGPAEVAHLKPLLEDSSALVRQTAAGALYRLNDTSGLPILEQLARSTYPGVRNGAASLMASHPDADWQTLVRSLATESDPTIRVNAARLIAPYDPDLARSVLEQLLKDPNIAIREEAGRQMAENVPTDLPTLRSLLKSPDTLTRVRAASRLLAMTR